MCCGFLLNVGGAKNDTGSTNAGKNYGSALWKPPMKPKRPQGRPPVKPGEQTVTICLRVTESQRDKVVRLGGEAGWAWWVRDRIERAKEK